MAKKQFDIDKVCWMIRGAYTYAKDEKWIMKPLAWALYEVWKIVDKWEKENSVRNYDSDEEYEEQMRCLDEID